MQFNILKLKELVKRRKLTHKEIEIILNALILAGDTMTKVIITGKSFLDSDTVTDMMQVNYNIEDLRNSIENSEKDV